MVRGLGPGGGGTCSFIALSGGETGSGPKKK